MTGSLQIKDNKYYIVLNSYASGKRRQKWIRTDAGKGQQAPGGTTAPPDDPGI